MKYLKMLGLMAVAAAALMAFAGTASATELTSEGKTYTGEITAVSEGEHVILHGSFGITVECSSHVAGNVEKHGAGVPVSGKITELSFTNCTEEYEVTVLEKGSLSIHENGTVTSSGTKVTVHTPLGINCVYTTNNTDIGNLTGSNEVTENNPKAEGDTATFDIEAQIPRTGHSFLCGGSGEWTGNYIITTPDDLVVHE